MNKSELKRRITSAINQYFVQFDGYYTGPWPQPYWVTHVYLLLEIEKLNKKQLGLIYHRIKDFGDDIVPQMSIPGITINYLERGYPENKHYFDINFIFEVYKENRPTYSLG